MTSTTAEFIYIHFYVWNLNIYVYCTQFQLKLISSLHFSTLQFSTKIHRCNSKIKKRNEKHTWLSAPYVNTERFYWHIPDHQSCQRSSRGEPVYSPSLWCWWQIEPHCKREPVYKQCILLIQVYTIKCTLHFESINYTMVRNITTQRILVHVLLKIL